MTDLNGMSVAEILDAAAKGSRPWLPRPCARLRAASERGRSCADGPGSFKRPDCLRPAQALQIKPLVATAASNEMRRHFDVEGRLHMMTLRARSGFIHDAAKVALIVTLPM